MQGVSERQFAAYVAIKRAQVHRKGSTPSSKRTCLDRNDVHSKTSGRLIQSMRKCRKPSRIGSEATRCQSGGRTGVAQSSTCRSIVRADPFQCS